MKLKYVLKEIKKELKKFVSDNSEYSDPIDIDYILTISALGRVLKKYKSYSKKKLHAEVTSKEQFQIIINFFHKERFNRIYETDSAYWLAINSPGNQLCINIANIISKEINLNLETKSKPKNYSTIQEMLQGKESVELHKKSSSSKISKPVEPYELLIPNFNCNGIDLSKRNPWDWVLGKGRDKDEDFFYPILVKETLLEQEKDRGTWLLSPFFDGNGKRIKLYNKEEELVFYHSAATKQYKEDIFSKSKIDRDALALNQSFSEKFSQNNYTISATYGEYGKARFNQRCFEVFISNWKEIKNWKLVLKNLEITTLLRFINTPEQLISQVKNLYAALEKNSDNLTVDEKSKQETIKKQLCDLLQKAFSNKKTLNESDERIAKSELLIMSEIYLRILNIKEEGWGAMYDSAYRRSAKMDAIAHFQNFLRSNYSLDKWQDYMIENNLSSYVLSLNQGNEKHLVTLSTQYQPPAVAPEMKRIEEVEDETSTDQESDEAALAQLEPGEPELTVRASKIGGNSFLKGIGQITSEEHDRAPYIYFRPTVSS